MAKVVFKTTPNAAYEWAEVEGGATMSHVDRVALLDEFVSENGLVPVETTFRGEVPDHKYGRYKAGFAGTASALPPALPTSQSDINKANADLDALRAENARLLAQLGKSKGAEVVKDDDAGNIDNQRGSATGGAQTTEDAREALSKALPDGVDLVSSSEEVRENMATADRSDDNPRIDQKPKGKPGPKPKAK